MMPAYVLSGLAILALWVFVRARRREARALQKYPPTGQILMVNGFRVHAKVSSSGPDAAPRPDLVLLHGASGNLLDFDALTARLAPDFRVIAFDRPGLGHSQSLGRAGRSLAAQARHLQAAAAQLGADNPILVGQSYGGAVALAWALSGRAKALVLIAAPSLPWPGGLGPWYPIAASPVGRWLVAPVIAAFAPYRLAKTAIAEIFAPDTAPDGYAKAIAVPLTLRSRTIHDNAAQVHDLKRHLVAQMGQYPRLTLPVELLHGTADTIVPAHIHSEPLAAILPNARLTLLPGLGHMVHHAAPEASVLAIRRAASLP